MSSILPERHCILVVILYFVSLAACRSADTAPVFHAEDSMGSISLVQLPSSERFPAEASYFKLLVSNTEIKELRGGLKTNEALADLQSVDYYLNFGLRQDLRLIVGADTLSPTTFFREDYIAELPRETVLVGFDTPHGTEQRFRIQGPLVTEALQIDLSAAPNSSR